jgi:A/G-specific adenine glycosylase
VQRPLKGLLGGLWEFPNWEVDVQKRPEKELARRVAGGTGLRVKSEESVGLISQTFSHFRLTLHVYSCKAKGQSTRGRWLSLSQLDDYPMSRLHRKIAKNLSTGLTGKII